MRFVIALWSVVCLGQATNVRVSTSTTQAIMSYTSPDLLACTLQVSESVGLSPLVYDVDNARYTGANSDSRTGNIAVGRFRQFIIGKRSIELANTGAQSGRYFSRALQANTKHYYSLSCTGGAVTGSFSTTELPWGNSFPELFPGDIAHAGVEPYPYLDPSTRNSSYIDPQTGLKHVAITAPSDLYESGYANQTYDDAKDMDGATWTNPTNVYGSGTATTSTTGTGYLWIGVRNTQLAGTYDFSSRGPSYDDQLASATNGSINYYQVSLDAKVSSGTDSIIVCLTVNRSTCATTPSTVNITSSYATYTVGSYSATPTGADPTLVNASPVINRWEAYSHLGTVTADGSGNVALVSGPGFNVDWGSSSAIRFSAVSTANACSAGTSHTISSVTSITAMVTADMPAANTYYYCGNNFGVLVKRTTPDARTVSIENAKFNISYSPGPVWFSTADVTPLSYVKQGNGYYMLVPAASAPMLLYYWDTVTATSTFIGPMKPNSNSSGSDQWLYYQQPSTEFSPFDTVNSTSTHLVYYGAGVDINGKKIIIRTDLSGTPTYQQNASALMDESGATITYPDAYSVRVVNHGMTATFTNITPASLSKDLDTQMATVTGYNSAFMSVTFGAVQNGYLFLQGRGNQDTIGVFARLNPATGSIDNSTDSYSRPNCRWCVNHSGIAVIGDPSYMEFGANNSAATGSTNGAGPWYVSSTDAISASPAVTCPSNSIGAPTTGTACSIYTLTTHGGANPYEPYDPDPGASETDFLQTAAAGDRFCVTTSSSACNYANEIMVLVSKSGATWTVWRPGTLNGAGLVTIAGGAAKYFWTACTAVGPATDSNGINQGANSGGPQWDSTTSGTSATWYPDTYFVSGHIDEKFNDTFDGSSILGQISEVCQEKIFCGIPGSDGIVEGYRVRQGVSTPTILSTAPTFTMATPIFQGKQGLLASGSHLSIGGLSSSFVDDRPFTGDALGCTWTLQGGTTHTYKAATCTPVTLNRKFVQTTAVAGPHVLLDISSATTGNVLTDSTDYSYCVSNATNECRTGSAAGDIYVSASQRTYLGCWPGYWIGDIFTALGNVQEDICVSQVGITGNTVEQHSMEVDPIGWRKARALTYLAGKNKMSDSFANVRALADSSWMFGMERWGMMYRSEVVAVKLPSEFTAVDSVNRGAFVPVQIQIKGASGTDGAVADFGYAEYGSDGITKFYCTSRQENCVANQATIGTIPFYWAGESLTPLSCASGCTLTIPAVPGRVLYYRIRRTNSGTTISTSQANVVVNP